jgi:hypothetical protein
MTWMTDPHAVQILRGLYPDQYTGWKVWRRYGFVVLLAGIAAGGSFLKMRPSSSPIAPVTPEVGAAPKTTTFPSLLTADLPAEIPRHGEGSRPRPDSIEITSSGLGEDLDRVKRLAEMGVARLVPIFPPEKADKVLPIVDRWTNIMRQVSR